MKTKIARAETDFFIEDFDNEVWKNAEEILIKNYWLGTSAPKSRHFKTRLLWTDAAFYIRFEAVQAEPLIVGGAPDLKTKTIGLWDRDVCEIFVAPDKNEPEKYFEFEIAPTGEWIDLQIRRLPNGERETDFEYDSGMQSAARIEKDKVLSAIKIEWRAFGKAPAAGDVWRANLFRCVGAGETRGYLAWQPTRTQKPNFHVPEAFGAFEFVK